MYEDNSFEALKEDAIISWDKGEIGKWFGL